MTAKIYRPAKTAMQSGKAKTHLWVLEFDQEEPRKIDPVLGYTSSSDMKQQVRLTFESLEQAQAYASAMPSNIASFRRRMRIARSFPTR